MNFIFMAAEGNLQQIKKQLSFGRNINYKDYDNWTALHLACSNGHTKVIKYLILHGADKSIVDWYGKTAYDYAKEKGIDINSI